MGGVISILVCVGAAFRFYNSGHPLLLTVSIVVAVVVFWSVGVMHNYASYARRDRVNRIRENARIEGTLDNAAEARLGQFERGLEPNAIPNWLAMTNLVSTVVGIILFVTSLILR